MYKYKYIFTSSPLPWGSPQWVQHRNMHLWPPLPRMLQSFPLKYFVELAHEYWKALRGRRGGCTDKWFLKTASWRFQGFWCVRARSPEGLPLWHREGVKCDIPHWSLTFSTSLCVCTCVCYLGPWPAFHTPFLVPSTGLTLELIKPHGTCWPVTQQQHENSNPNALRGRAAECVIISWRPLLDNRQ